MKTIERLPFVKVVKSEADKVFAAVRNANYPWYVSFFVYTNIVLYFAYMFPKIYF